jgi:hypothetical protein
MKKQFFRRQVLILIIGLFIITSFTNEKTIKISYQMEDVKEYVPSYQLCIWLEKPDGTFVKSLFVSEWLAYGGYLDYGVCPSWTENASWDKVTKEEFDAVSGATPDVGNVKLELENSINNVPDGEYLLSIQIHLKEDLNDTYKGKVNLKAGKKIDIQLKPYKIQRIKDGKQKGIISNIEVTIN